MKVAHGRTVSLVSAIALCAGVASVGAQEQKAAPDKSQVGGAADVQGKGAAKGTSQFGSTSAPMETKEGQSETQSGEPVQGSAKGGGGADTKK